jgi:hypothetical protein
LYDYKYVRIEAIGFITRKPKEDYHKVIDEHAKQGWRLVQILISSTANNGMAEFYELIFEKQN